MGDFSKLKVAVEKPQMASAPKLSQATKVVEVRMIAISKACPRIGWYVAGAPAKRDRTIAGSAQSVYPHVLGGYHPVWCVH